MKIKFLILFLHFVCLLGYSQGKNYNPLMYRDIVAGIWPDSNGIPVMPTSQFLPIKEVKEKKIKEIIQYNNDGNVLIHETFDVAGKLIQSLDNNSESEKTANFYKLNLNADGKILSLELRFIQGRRELIKRISYEYKNNQVVSEKVTCINIRPEPGVKHDSFFTTSKFTYNNKKQLVLKEIFNENNMRDSKTEFQYTESGLVSRIKHYDDLSILIKEEIFEYDKVRILNKFRDNFTSSGTFSVVVPIVKNGKIVSEKYYNNSDTVSLRVLYTYNSKGECTQTYFEPNGEYSTSDVKSTSHFYKQGKLDYEIYSAAGKKKYKRSYIYEQIDGLLSEIVSLDLDDNDDIFPHERIRIEYKFFK